MTAYFDLDGTLIDSSARHGVLLKKILVDRLNGYDKMLVGQYMEYKRAGNGTYEFLINILKLDKEDALEICNDWRRDIEKDQYLDMDILYEETFDVLDFLKDSNVQIAYISARMNRAGVLQELERLNIAKYPKNIFIVDSQNAFENKYNAIARHVMAEDLVIGDTEVDYYLGKKLKVSTLILNRGFRNKEYWDNLGIVSYGQILPALKKIM